MAALTEGSVIVGSAAIIRANGVPVGDATGITINITSQNNQVRVMGSRFAKEIVEGNITCSVSINKFLIYKDSPIVQGLFPASTNAAVWSSPYLDLELVDADDTAPVFGALRCKPATLTVAVDQGGVAGANQTFDATWYTDDRPLAVEG